MNKVTITCLLSALLFCSASASETNPSKLDDSVRAQQIKDMKWGMFVCWSFSTFSGYEWTPGVEDISFFNPTGADPEQWCKAAKDANMGYILFLTKHHDGFCLWDTQTTDRKVSNTPALKGRDILAELRKACDKHGLKLALYYSEGDWSWNPKHKGIHKSVPNPEAKKAQLKELLTNYGPIEFFWFDHAVNDGGLSHQDTVKWVHQFQPNTFCGFNTGQTAGRLNLRERGRPGAIGDKTAAHGKNHHKTSYSAFKVAEFTYPILEGQNRKKMRGAQWFYSLPENDHKAASPDKIYQDYLGAVKYGNIFSLNIGPDRSGKLREIDIKTLKTVGQYIRKEKTPSAIPPSTKP
ncbi:alpha-L-fucosidase [Verrucomicrobiaceae bacterium N1E253]|uniref:alpha-L-fucosidase n=1 Tax=Oceaniferula marina TaxID=2748318 RepID=A0A851GDM7_9BACT|nr:alpha-L-fucosidase [Oceaniferula marina]NWK55042.1 alpha-L-fucosidase [Oceaniferula marina]